MDTAIKVGLAGGAGLLALLALTQVLVWWTRIRTKGMPGPGFFWAAWHLKDFHAATSRLHQANGGINQLFMGPSKMVIVSDPECLKQVLMDQKTFPKVPPKDILTSKQLATFMGTNFLGQTAGAWKRAKSNFSAAFHMMNVKNFIPTFHSSTRRMVQAWEKDSGVAGGAFELDAKPWLSRLALDILSHTIFGYDLGALPSPDGSATDTGSHLLEAYNAFFEAAGDIRAASVPFYDMWPFEYQKKLPVAISTLNKLILDMIAKHETELDEEAKLLEAGGESTLQRNLLHSFIETIRSNESELTQEDLRANLVLFFVAGHETTATASAWALHLLATLPDVQDKLRAEVLEHTPDDGSSPTYEDMTVTSMPYLDAFIREAMRKYPPIGCIHSRIAARDADLGGYRILKGSIVSLSAYNIHHDPNVWPEPDEFRPERFLNRDRTRHPYAYMPFSLGQRMCIGSNFSILEQRIFLIEVLRRYEVHPPAAALKAGGHKTTHDGPTANMFTFAPNRMTVRLQRRP